MTALIRLAIKATGQRSQASYWAKIVGATYQVARNRPDEIPWSALALSLHNASGFLPPVERAEDMTALIRLAIKATGQRSQASYWAKIVGATYQVARNRPDEIPWSALALSLHNASGFLPPVERAEDMTALIRLAIKATGQRSQASYWLKL
ncbi:MAG: hypothetical protein OXG60_06890 [Chloroflexi bacterium]|nr:hypothetical protein [Chloroflexota bacterium]